MASDDGSRLGYQERKRATDGGGVTKHSLATAADSVIPQSFLFHPLFTHATATQLLRSAYSILCRCSHSFFAPSPSSLRPPVRWLNPPAAGRHPTQADRLPPWPPLAAGLPRRSHSLTTAIPSIFPLLSAVHSAKTITSSETLQVHREVEERKMQLHPALALRKASQRAGKIAQREKQSTRPEEQKQGSQEKKGDHHKPTQALPRNSGRPPDSTSAPPQDRRAVAAGRGGTKAGRKGQRDTKWA